MNNHHLKEIILKGILSAIFLLITTVVTAVGKESGDTGQKALQGGMQSGGRHFMANCVTCHGAQGKGDGVLAYALEVKPIDLSNKVLMSARSDKYLFKVIKYGGLSVGLTASMPFWEATFSNVEIKNIIKYIRSDICKCKFIGKK